MSVRKKKSTDKKIIQKVYWTSNNQKIFLV